MKIYALGVFRPDDDTVELAGEPALSLRWDVVDRVRHEVQKLDDAIVKSFPNQRPKTFVVAVFESEPTVAEVPA